MIQKNSLQAYKDQPLRNVKEIVKVKDLTCPHCKKRSLVFLLEREYYLSGYPTFETKFICKHCLDIYSSNMLKTSKTNFMGNGYEGVLHI